VGIVIFQRAKHVLDIVAMMGRNFPIIVLILMERNYWNAQILTVILKEVFNRVERIKKNFRFKCWLWDM